ncbi:MAG TPA: aminotransferase class I/II-fold pyridoxal phosphate-dependent enzyme [Nitrospirae bacterium]|nr:aminotransferase class I/II-fold pyridoxal phosphate-dependent enzyme [Nitrospirota bacterium]
MKKDTQCVHSGTYRDRDTRGVNTPVFTSSSFEYLDTPYNIYPRYFNTPNQRAVVDKLCALENAEDGLLFSSGMAAISTVMLTFLGSGDHVVLKEDIYGGTHHFVTADFKRFGIEYTFVSNNTEDIEKAARENTRLIFIESPSNPLLKITDIRAVAEIAKSKNIVTAIDNTFATPINQNPMELGIDIVIHSGTKYLGGHSDICCGAVVSTESLTRRIRGSAVNFGGSLNADACYLLERSMKTLGIRVERQCMNAQYIAESLKDNPDIKKVYYPGLKSRQGHDTAKSQMRGFGAIVSFELDGQKTGPSEFIRRLRLITPAVSLGGVESLICAPAETSHEKLSDEERKELGITDGLFRLSVGIEDSADILSDIEQALKTT